MLAPRSTPSRGHLLVVGLPLLASALACGGGKKGEDDTGAGAGTGEETLGTTDVDWSGTCPSISGIGEGARWEYVYNEAFEEASSLSGSYTVEVSEVGDDGTVTLVTSVDTVGSNNSFSSVTTNQYGCDTDGMWLIGTYYEYAVTVYYTYEGYQTYEWYAPALIMPGVVEVGTEWDTVYDGVYEDELGARRAQDYTVVNEVMGLVEVETPAGTYTAQEWVQDSSLGVPVTNYYVNGVGLVKTAEADLVSVSN